MKIKFSAKYVDIAILIGVTKSDYTRTIASTAVVCSISATNDDCIAAENTGSTIRLRRPKIAQIVKILIDCALSNVWLQRSNKC